MLLVVKALTFREQEIKAPAYQFHDRAAIVVFTHAQTVNFKNRRDALVSFLLKSLFYIFWCIGTKKTLLF